MLAKHRDLEEHFLELQKQGDAVMLPQKISEVRIENVDPIGKLKLTFDEGLNLVLGPAGFGKTVLLKTLKYTLRALQEKPSMSGHAAASLKVNFNTPLSRQNCLLLLDEPAAMFERRKRRSFMNWLERKFPTDSSATPTAASTTSVR